MQSLLKKTSLLPCAAMGRGAILFVLFLFLGLGVGLGQITVEFNQATGSDAENSGGNLPEVIVTGEILAPAEILVSDLGSGTATSGVDFNFASPNETIPIPAGDYSTPTAFPLTSLSINGDLDAEQDETIVLTILLSSGNVSGGTITFTTYTISNDDGVSVEFSQGASSDDENTGGNLPALFVTGTVVNATTVTVTDAGTGTATSGEDYAFTSPQLVNIPAGPYDGTSGTAIAVPALSITGDADVEVDETVNLSLGTPTGDASLGGQTSTTYTISNDDVGDVTISATDASAAETGPDTGEFEIDLGAVNATGSPITINYVVNGASTADSGDDFNALPLSLAIPDGSQTGTILLTAVDDGDVEEQEFLRLELTGTSNATLFPIGTLNTADVTIDSEDLATVSIANDTDGEENNGGGPVTNGVLTVSQSEESPVDTDITYTISGGTATEGVDFTALSGTVTILTGDTSAEITIPVLEDVIIEGDETIEVTLTGVSGGLAALDVPANIVATNTIIDDDSAGFTATESAGNTITSEAGTTDTFTVVLDAQPTTNVVLDIASDDIEEGDVNFSQITFTNANWDTPQQITVTGIDDDIIDGTQSYNITISVNDVASDDAFDLLADQTVSVDNTDNDTAGITITETDGNTITSEDGTVDTFDVVLNAEPTTDVVIDIASEDTNEGAVSPPSLTFTSGNWDTPQTVTVTGVDDAIIDGDEAYNITVSVNNGASDNDFDNISENVSAENTDNDSASFTIVETDGSTNTSEDETTDTFTVVLDIQPNSNVVFDVVSEDTGEATVSPSTLTFTPANWNTPQTVTVTGDNDFFVDGPQTVDITISVDNSESAIAFNNLSDVVEVTNSDNDTAGFTIAESDGETSVSETGTTDTFTVVLNRGTVFSNVIINIDSEDTGEGTVSPTSLTFTPANWNVPQTATVTGVDDAIVDGTVNFDVVVDVNSSSALSYALLPEQTVNVENIDDDSASVTIANTSGNEDDGPITVSAILNNEVTGGFTVDVLSSDGTATTASSDYTAVNETLTFAGTAGEVQTFEVVPTADALVEDNETVEVVMDNLAGTTLTVGISDAATITINNDDACAAGTATPTLNDANDEFCVEVFSDFSQELDDYVDGTSPAGSQLVWSTNPDTDQTDDYLSSSVITGSQVVDQNTYYGFYYDSLNDCAGPNTVQVVLSVNEEPNPGTTTGASVCADSGNGNTILDLDDRLSADADPGVWTITDAQTGSSITINGGNVVDFDGQPFGDYTFTYTATASGICADQTVELVVTVSDCAGPCNAGDTAPAFNGADTTIEFCDEVDTDLDSYVSGTAPTGATLIWSTSSEPTETAAHLNSGEVVEPGTYYGFYYDEVNDCGSPVLAITLVRNFTPTIDSTSGDSSCDSAALTLTATASVADESTISYTWYDAPTGGNIVGTSATYNTGTLSETTSFYVTASANGCESDRVEVVATINDQLSAGIPIEGLTVCNISSDDGPTTFDLDDGLMGQDLGTWAIITDPSNGDAAIGADNSVDFTGLVSGNYVFEYTTDTVGNCTETSSAQLTLTVQDCISNEAIDLAITKTLDGSNSQLIGDEVIFIINVEKVEGSTVTDIVISDVLDDAFEFLDAEASLGTYDANTGEWNIPEMLSTDLNATLRITVRVIEAGDIPNTAILVSSIPADEDTIDNNTDTVMVTVNRSQCEDPGTICNIFSPNGDGRNDTLTLVDHTSYPNNSFEVFDRYGNNVFQMDGYDSSWDGTGKNGDLPKGTYFYVLDLNGDGTDVVKGWIQIVR